MFSDPFAAVMALVILNFAGTLLMFVFGLRSLDAQQKTLKELKNQISVDAADLDQRLRELEYTLRKITPAQGAENGEDLGRLLDKAVASGSLASFAAPAPASFAEAASALSTATPAVPATAATGAVPPAATAQAPQHEIPRIFPLEEEESDSADAWNREHPLSLK